MIFISRSYDQSQTQYSFNYFEKFIGVMNLNEIMVATPSIIVAATMILCKF